jgi:hypothetical protein
MSFGPAGGMMSDIQMSSGAHVCCNCIGDRALAETVAANGLLEECAYCKDRSIGLKLSELAGRVHSVVRRDFVLTPSEPRGWDDDEHWERTGDSVNGLIRDIAGLSERLADNVVRVLSALHGPEAVRDFDEDPYGPDARYAPMPPFAGNDLLKTWNSFKNDLVCRSRFFSTAAEAALSMVFEAISGLKSRDGWHVVVPAGPNTAHRQIFRARAALSWPQLTTILSAAVAELGAPPSQNARAGRMNAAGIPVFYGATEADTCVAEIRAPVGAHVVIGRFEILRPLRLLDLNALSDVYEPGSHFDAEFPHRGAKAAFLQHVVSEMTRPVMPSDEAYEYLPTQAVAEYLGQRVSPRIDGILFRSAQTGGCNLVLLNHACTVEPYLLPEGTQVEVDERMFYGDREDDIQISEIVPWGVDPVMWQPPQPDVPLAPERGPVLRLKVNEIQVRQVKAVVYESVEIPTSRIREEAEPEGDSVWDRDPGDGADDELTATDESDQDGSKVQG